MLRCTVHAVFTSQLTVSVYGAIFIPLSYTIYQNRLRPLFSIVSYKCISTDERSIDDKNHKIIPPNTLKITSKLVCHPRTWRNCQKSRTCVACLNFNYAWRHSTCVVRRTAVVGLYGIQCTALVQRSRPQQQRPRSHRGSNQSQWSACIRRKYAENGWIRTRKRFMLKDYRDQWLSPGWLSPLYWYSKH